MKKIRKNKKINVKKMKKLQLKNNSQMKKTSRFRRSKLIRIVWAKGKVMRSTKNIMRIAGSIE
jgi:hypothetical protein